VDPLAEVDGNRTRRTRIARPNRFEGGGAHQVPGHLRSRLYSSGIDDALAASLSRSHVSQRDLGVLRWVDDTSGCGEDGRLRCGNEAPDSPCSHHRHGRRGRQEIAVVLTVSLLCSQAALQQYGAAWRVIAPDIEFVVLPAEGRLNDDDVARIDFAVFSHDLWMGGRGASFFKVLLNAPNAKWLHMFAAGTDDPIFAEIHRRGIRLTHSAGSSATPIAHTVIMHTLALCREARPLAVAQSQHVWADREVTDVEGRTMGIIGLGSIGSEVARLAQQFGMRVIGLRRTPRGDEPGETWPTSRLHELLPLVDDLVLTAPLTDETRNIIGTDELALLPRGAHIINVGRGQLIDEPALIEALQSGHIGGAALDVFVVEPLPTDNPLWDMPNVIVTPHSAGGTVLATQRAADMFADNLGRCLRGEPMVNEVT